MLKKILLLSAMSVISFDNSNASMVEYNNDQERRAMIQFRSYYDNSIELFQQYSQAAQNKDDNPHNKELNRKEARKKLENAYRFMDDNMYDKNKPNTFTNDDVKDMYRYCMTLYTIFQGYETDTADLWLRLAITKAKILTPDVKMNEELYNACKHFSNLYLEEGSIIYDRLLNNFNVRDTDERDYINYKKKYKRWEEDAEIYRYKGYFESFTNAVKPVVAFFWEYRGEVSTIGTAVWNNLPTTNSNNSNNQAIISTDSRLADARFELERAKQLRKCVSEGDYKGAKQFLNYDKK